MHCYILDSNVRDVYYNLALEYTMAENNPTGSAILFLWQNANTVVIGKHQNPYRECNLIAIKADNIMLARRPSGGGAVFHDKANLNFSFIYAKGEYNLSRNYKIIIDALSTLGIDAYTSGRNDILFQDKKFSGNAFYTVGNARVHHGTIMVGVNMDSLAKYLSASNLKLASKGVASVSSRVINLASVQPSLTVDRVKEKIKTAFLQYHNKKKALDLQVQNKKVLLVKNKIQASDYIMGKKYNFAQQVAFRLPLGEVMLSISEDKQIEVHSDFLDTSLIEYAKERLAQGERILPNKQFNNEQNKALVKIGEMAKELRNGL